MPLQMDEGGNLVRVDTGPLANNNDAACGCCEPAGETCCDRGDPGPVLYMTVDNFEIDFPVRSIYSPWGVDDSLCTTFPDEAELEAMGFNAIASGTGIGSNWGWGYGVGAVPPIAAPSIVVPGHGPTPLAQHFYVNTFLGCADVGGLKRWRFLSPAFPGNYLFMKVTNYAFSTYAWQRCYCYPRSDSGLFPDFGLVGVCDPINLEAVVECYFGKYSTYYTANDGHCRTTGRCRIRITE